MFKSSSLPAREGALESSNGEAKGLIILESRLPTDSELQLVRRDDIAVADLNGESSLVPRSLDLPGGKRSSADSATFGWR